MKKVLIEEPFRVSVKRDAQIPTPKEGHCQMNLRQQKMWIVFLMQL